VLPDLQADNAHQVMDIPLETLMHPPILPVTTLSGKKKWQTPSPFTIINLSLLATLWAILSVAYLYWRRRRAVRKRPVILPTEPQEALPLAPAHQQPQVNPPAVKIWPVLPPLSDCTGQAMAGTCITAAATVNESCHKP